MVLSIGTPSGSRSTTCGYCSPPGQRSTTKSAAHAAGFLAHQLSCQVYQKMVDRGWRRSGIWCYKPDLRHSCCPHYTIKLDASNFKVSKSKRKIINRWTRFILHGKQSESKPLPNQKSKDASFSLSTAIRAAEVAFTVNESPAHRFEVTLEPSSYSKEKFELYCTYQRDIHHDLENTPSGFKTFLVNSPLSRAPIPYPSPPPSHLPVNYGSYHQLYRCDDKLIALGVIDILPNCVSSVYFMYDSVRVCPHSSPDLMAFRKEWEEFSLGKLSALREVSLASEIQESGVPEMGWLYMGFYIHSCPKMRYKGDYSPSYLADPETYDWHPLEICVPLLEEYRYARFSEPLKSTNETPSFVEDEDPPQPDDDLLSQIHLVRDIVDNKIHVIPANLSPYWMIDELRCEILECVEALGQELSKEIIFHVDE
ncbi:arginine-tRNA-protein transferase [Mycena pura]|uniref:Arginyl-tRNA--protein transferase 1 n=1 Tax=Mycena pura TaxID=153505 RepID=A0AAD7E4T6_9AGAR|nr:arginine-tRNA-protein transferase [Mycena pura]